MSIQYLFFSSSIISIIYICVCVCVCDMIFVYSNTTLNILLFTWYVYKVFFFFFKLFCKFNYAILPCYKISCNLHWIIAITKISPIILKLKLIFSFAYVFFFHFCLSYQNIISNCLFSLLVDFLFIFLHIACLKAKF